MLLHLDDNFPTCSLSLVQQTTRSHGFLWCDESIGSWQWETGSMNAKLFTKTFWGSLWFSVLERHRVIAWCSFTCYVWLSFALWLCVLWAIGIIYGIWAGELNTWHVWQILTCSTSSVWLNSCGGGHVDGDDSGCSVGLSCCVNTRHGCLISVFYILRPYLPWLPHPNNSAELESLMAVRCGKFSSKIMEFLNCKIYGWNQASTLLLWMWIVGLHGIEITLGKGC